MLTARAFCSARRSAGLPSGLVPPPLTAIAMSLPTLVNCFATRSMRAKMADLRFSKARPIRLPYNEWRRRGYTGRRGRGALQRPAQLVHVRPRDRSGADVGEDPEHEQQQEPDRDRERDLVD